MKHLRSTGARDLAFKYLQRTSDLREMARHLDMEVQWYSGHFGLTDEQVKLSREKAPQLWIAADEADQLAREYRRQVLHGQVS